MGFFDDIGKWGTRLFRAPGTTSESGLDKIGSSQQETMFNQLQSGIAPWQQAGFDQAVSQAMTKFSAANALRGGQNPFTIPQIASSAAQYAAPQFALANTQAMANLIGTRNRSAGVQQGSGIGYNLASTPQGAGMLANWGSGLFSGAQSAGGAAKAGATWLGGLF